MTVFPIPASSPRTRLWLAATILACCSAVYVIVAPLLYRGARAGWPTVAGAGVADAAAIGALVMIWLLRRASAATGDALAARDQQAGRQEAEYRQREQQLLQESADMRARHAALQADCAELRDGLARNAQAVRQAMEHAVTLRIPVALAGDPVPGALADGISADLAELLDRAVSAAASAGGQLESVRAAMVALSRRVQASAHRLQEEATLMAERHPGDADVLEVSMRVDHAAAQQARHAQSMAVLSGEWPGQQWPDPLPLVDVVRAAAGRIIAYQRVQVAGDPDIAAAAAVVEPLIHLTAELLANATQSSPPTTEVPVTVRAVQRGAVIEIHDCGVGLDEHQLARARDIAAGTRVVGLGGLGEFPQTGLPVVGQYARRHGFRVDLSESVYGGVRAVVGIPAESVETVAPADIPAIPAPAVLVPDARIPDGNAAAGDSTGSGLPRRHSPRHGAAVTDASAGRVAGPAKEHPQLAATPEEAGAWMGAFLGTGLAAGGGSAGEDDWSADADAESTRAEKGWER